MKKPSEEALFSDDDDFLGGLGIEEKQSIPAPKVREVEEEEQRPAKSAMDKLLGKNSSVSKHLEPAKERKEFVLDSKYTQPAGKLFLLLLPIVNMQSCCRLSCSSTYICVSNDT